MKKAFALLLILIGLAFVMSEGPGKAAAGEEDSAIPARCEATTRTRFMGTSRFA
jgi:hypothetical protein